MTPDMIALLAFAAVGSVALFDILNGDDDDPVQQEDDTVLARSPNEGTDGDDVVTDYDPAADTDGTLSVLAGDDFVSIADDPDVYDPFEFDVSLGDGNDTLEFGNQGELNSLGEISNIDAGTGNDLVKGADTRGRVFLGEGNDTLQLGSVVHFVSGGAGDDLIQFDDLIAGVNGGDGNDTIEAGRIPGGSLDGGDGDDYIVVDFTNANGFIDGGAGDDTISVVSHYNSGLIGGEGDDVIELQPVPEDIISFISGTASGGEGADTFVVTPKLVSDWPDEYTLAEFAAGNAAPWQFLDIEFEAGVDHLVIDPTSNVEGFDFTGYEVTANSVILSYVKTDDPSLPFQMEAILRGDPISASDVTIVNA